jgi:SNF2 family DNA or RNA helicase
VLFNWQQEAARFAPQLRVLDFAGADRSSRMHLITESDVVLATYGTLRRDVVALADIEFDYVVLDEAQTIKNANTASAKATRLLRGEHRLALSGTPVENRLADLWSIFEFLNPGLLSGATAFGRSFTGNSSPEELAMLSRGLRPFILRRTKEQVATELPAKTEQTIVCDLERRQRTLYDELRNHYRQRLLGRPGDSWRRSKIQVLEALLRLRQAASHPALIDPARAGEPSAKLDLLVPRLIETIDEGHKALVFSQFTSFLALLRKELDDRGISYEYLDGATRDREQRVEHFQRDPACGLFLISLKAGGVGLNLTAADYVFILDPWWNPAAEAQAVDRTHRIGQERHVFAYRLIARDTVEERVLELQQRKRELADAIITADNSIVRTLQREDLEALLS